MARRFIDLSEQEILALAISSEEDDARIYGDVAEGLKAQFPATAAVFEGMQGEESEHRRRLTEEFVRRFGNHIPLIRRDDVKGFVRRKPIWLIRPLGIKAVRGMVDSMELETRRFYERAAQRVSDASTRTLLSDLSEAE